MPITSTSISATEPKGDITFAAKSIQASLQGLLNGHSIKKMGLATLVGTSAFSTTCYAFANLKYPDQLTPMEHVQILSIGAFLGLTSNIINKEMEKRSSFFREHKKINLITAGLASSTIVSSAMNTYWRRANDPISVTASVMIIDALAMAPIGTAAAWAGK